MNYGRIFRGLNSRSNDPVPQPVSAGDPVHLKEGTYMSNTPAAATRAKTTEEVVKSQPSVDEQQLLDWDYALEVVPPPRRSGTIEVTLNKVTLSPELIETEP